MALGAVRSELRKQGQQPTAKEGDEALAVLDNIYRIDRTVLASYWYATATQTELNRFVKEWKK